MRREVLKEWDVPIPVAINGNIVYVIAKLSINEDKLRPYFKQALKNKKQATQAWHGAIQIDVAKVWREEHEINV